MALQVVERPGRGSPVLQGFGEGDELLEGFVAHTFRGDQPIPVRAGPLGCGPVDEREHPLGRPGDRGHRPGRHLADVRDPQREDEAVEADGSAGLDAGKQLADRDIRLLLGGLRLLRGLLAGGRAALGAQVRPVAREGVPHRLEFEPEDVRRPLHEPRVEEHLDVGLAQALDVEGVLRHEVLEALHPLRRADEPAGAAPHRLPGLPHRVAAAGGAEVREHVTGRVRRALLHHHVEHLRDHVAGAQHHHGVADPDVPALADRLAVAADARM
jgi:hypothetical protein